MKKQSKTADIKIPENFTPIGRIDYLAVQHVERYRFAVSQLKPGMKVLDIASGTGYGTAMMLKHGCNVVGGDYDEETVKKARAIWNHKDFVRANGLKLPFEDESFDAVVTYETVEHVIEGEQFLSEMKRVLKKGGTFICSTPNIDYTFHPLYHIKEYKANEFFELAERVFPNAERYGQYFRPIDRFRDLYLRKLLPDNLTKLRNSVGPAFEKLGVKSQIKKWILGKHWYIRNPKANESITTTQWLDNILNENPDRFYKVKPFKGDKWLRIIIVIAKKEE